MEKLHPFPVNFNFLRLIHKQKKMVMARWRNMQCLSRSFRVRTSCISETNTFSMLPMMQTLAQRNFPFFSVQQRFYAQKSKIEQPSVVIGGEELAEEGKAEPIDVEVVEEQTTTNVTEATRRVFKQVERPDIFAVVQIGGKQFKVTKGDYLQVDRIPMDIDTQLKFQKVQHTHTRCISVLIFNKSLIRCYYYRCCWWVARIILPLVVPLSPIAML